MKFLCDQHRTLLQQSPTLAQARWEEWMTSGYQAMAEREWRRAISYYGCCYEVSEWQLRAEIQESATCNLKSLDQVMIAGHLLAESFGRSGNIPMERHCLLAVHNRLTALATRFLEPDQASRLRNNIELSLAMLKRHCKLHGDFGAMHACLQLTRSILNDLPISAALH